MNIQEILEAHDADWHQDDWWLVCKCGFEAPIIGGTGSEDARDSYRAHVAEVLDKHMQEREAHLRQLVRDMTDPGKCWFDHHGGCQEHGYLDLKPGELCPHAEAKQLLGDEPNGR